MLWKRQERYWSIYYIVEKVFIFYMTKKVYLWRYGWMETWLGKACTMDISVSPGSLLTKLTELYLMSKYYRVNSLNVNRFRMKYSLITELLRRKCCFWWSVFTRKWFNTPYRSRHHRAKTKKNPDGPSLAREPNFNIAIYWL